ncbi:MAG: DUF2244 domain-containing protein [Chromatiaceae bacterium]
MPWQHRAAHKEIGMVTADRCSQTDMQRLVIRPNQSLSWRQSMVFLGAIAVPLVIVSGVLAARGFWMILPFAGLEIAVLFGCMYLVSHACRRRQVVSVGGNTVTVEKGRERGRHAASGGPDLRVEFAREWARVELAPAVKRWHPRRLWIGASGRRVEIGEFLIDEEKAALAAQLKRLLVAA